MISRDNFGSVFSKARAMATLPTIAETRVSARRRATSFGVPSGKASSMSAASRRGRRATVRGARLCDAHLARSGQGGRLQAQRRRSASGAAGAERAGLRWHSKSAAGVWKCGLYGETLGRLTTPEQFADIILKTDAQGRPTRIRDVGHVEVGAADYGSTAYTDRSEGLPLLIFAQPGANSLAVEHAVLAKMADLKKDFPAGVSNIVIYDPTIFVAKSVHEVVTTIFVAIVLVVAVVFLFLQTWRASLIPVIAIPVSLVGTFLILLALGISLNNLSLFGLVLAVGIVVDDAIVVVENVERNISAGMTPEGGSASDDGRGRRRAGFHRTDAVRRIHSFGLFVRHLRAVLPPVRRDHRGINGDLLLRLAHPEPGTLRIAPAARITRTRPLPAT